jgi:hypothetical protein
MTSELCERALVCKSGSNYFLKDAAAAGKPILVYAQDTYDVFLRLSQRDSKVKEKVTPLRGQLTLVP